MSLKNILAAVGTAALTIGLATSGAFADAPPAAPKKKAAAPAKAAPAAEPARESHDRPHVGNWGGLYFGVNGGWYSADANWNFPTPSDSTTNASTSVDGALLGGHVGIQHQWGRIVAGVEATWSGTGIFGRESSDAHCGFPLRFQDACEFRKVDSIWTVGPRLGVAQDNWLFYVTGGFASGLVHTQIRFGSTTTPPPANQSVVHSAASRNDGYFIGGGVEWKLHDRWIFGLEYVHVALDSELHAVIPNVATFLDRRVDADIDIIRARLSFKLGRDDHAAAAAPMK